MKTTKSQTRTAEHRQSRAALRTIEQAVFAVEISSKRLGAHQEYLYSAHGDAVRAFQIARHHPLKGHDLHLVEEDATRLANLLDWPAALRARDPRKYFERRLTEGDSKEIVRWAGAAYQTSVELLGLSEMFDLWYGRLVVAMAEAARSALRKVTVETHQKRAGELMDRLDELCAEESLAGAIALANEGEEEDGHRQCGPSPAGWLH